MTNELKIADNKNLQEQIHTICRATNDAKL